MHDLHPVCLSSLRRSRLLPSELARAAKTAAARAGLVAAVVAILVASDPAHAITADSAEDVCPANANPCTVTEVVDVVDSSVLDFGTRSVQVTGQGQFNFDSGSGTILCGPFTASTDGVAIDANGPVGAGESDSGIVRIAARRTCDAGSSSQPCIDNGECQPGPCTARRCTGRQQKTCSEDLDCQIGPCTTSGRCQNSLATRCSSNADCDLGPCPAQLTCLERPYGTLNCSTDQDCDFGACTIGSASIVMDGSIDGVSDFPAFIDLRAADDVTILQSVDVSMGSPDSDGGELSVEAAAGSVVVTGKVRARSGSFGTGGDIALYAGQDVIISSRLDVDGGDFDGGTIDVDAGRDILVGAPVRASSRKGGGYGGEVLMLAHRDLIVGGPDAHRVVISTNGHTDRNGSAGDGGSQDLNADRDLLLGANARLVSRGSAPDGYGGDVTLDAFASVVVDGEIVATTRGTNGRGGDVEIFADGPVTVGTQGRIDVKGGQAGGGEFRVTTAGDIDFAGTADVGASRDGNGGVARLVSEANTRVSGTLAVRGQTSGVLEIDACRITLESGGRFLNGAAGGFNTLTAHESMSVLAGSEMTAKNGSNNLVYRTQDKPPVLFGTVSPVPVLTVDGVLEGCPVCGNSEIDEGEDCDDGNLADGDGCDSDCLTE